MAVIMPWIITFDNGRMLGSRSSFRDVDDVQEELMKKSTPLMRGKLTISPISNSVCVQYCGERPSMR